MSIKELLRLFGKERIIKVFQQPGLYLKEALILLGIFILCIFIILTLIGLIFVKSRKVSVTKAPPDEAAKHLIISNIIKLTIATLFLIAIFSMSFRYTSRSSFCQSCHLQRKKYQMWQVSSHKKVPCLACHQEPGMIGLLVEKIKMTKRAISYITSSPRSISSRVSNASCLQCHQDIEIETSNIYRIRVSHKEFLDAGYKCLTCHNDQAHKEIKQLASYYSGMAKCVTCHDSEKTSADCRLCHTEKGRKTSKVDISAYPKVHLVESVACQGCHPIENCTNCHKVELPHSKNWGREGGHAIEGFVNKAICQGCHAIDDCKRCHPGMPHPHPEDWPKTHGPASQLPEPSCPNCHNKEKFCGICHESP